MQYDVLFGLGSHTHSILSLALKLEKAQAMKAELLEQQSDLNIR